MAKDLSKEFDAEEDLSASFDAEPEAQQDIAPAAETQPSLGERVVQGAKDLGNSAVQTAKDMGRLAQSGAQLGFTDELTGLGSALGDVAGDFIFGLPKKDVQGYLDTYRQSQQASQKEEEKALQSSPVAGTVAKIGGSLIPAIATGGLAANPIAYGAGAGALSGLGESKGTLDTTEGAAQAAFDTGFGGLIGGTLGKYLPGKPGAKPKDIMEQGEFVPQLKTAYKLGEEGVSTSSSPAARSALNKKLGESEAGLAKTFTEPREQLGEAISGSLKKASQEGVVLMQEAADTDAIRNIGGVLRKNANAIGKKNFDRLAGGVSDLEKGLLSPQDAYNLRKELGGIISKVTDPNDQQILKTGFDSLKGMLEKSVPEFQGKLQDFAQFARSGPESLLSKGFDPEVADVFLGDLKNADLKVVEKVRDLLTKMRSGGKESLAKQGELSNTIDQLKQLGQKNPELLEKIGINPESLHRQFIKAADEKAVALKSTGEGALEAGLEKGLFGLRRGGEKALLRGANIAGGISKKAKDFFKADPQELGSVAGKLRELSDATLSPLGDALERAVQSGDINKRNAVLFAIMQSPKARDILGVSPENED